MEALFWLLGGFLLFFVVLFLLASWFEHYVTEQQRKVEELQKRKSRLARVSRQSAPRRQPTTQPTGSLQARIRKAEIEREVEADERRALRLRNLLVQRLRGDNAAAERLIEMARFKKPFMPESWYLEKVISDLERDRFR
jgi:hypothetical protein